MCTVCSVWTGMFMYCVTWEKKHHKTASLIHFIVPKKRFVWFEKVLKHLSFSRLCIFEVIIRQEIWSNYRQRTHNSKSGCTYRAKARDIGYAGNFPCMTTVHHSVEQFSLVHAYFNNDRLHFPSSPFMCYEEKNYLEYHLSSMITGFIFCFFPKEGMTKKAFYSCTKKKTCQ